MHKGVCWCIWLVVSFAIQQASCVSNEEINALQDFYIATNGSTTWDLPVRSWIFSGTPNPCSGTWRGIRCAGSSLTSFALSFSYGLLQGTLPGSLGDLVDLAVFSMESCQLSGTLPPELGRWSKIQYLNIKDNRFTGTLPSEWASLSPVVLEVSKNQLSGTIPSAWVSLLSVSQFILHNNQLCGDYPSTPIGSSDNKLYENLFACPIPDWCSLSACGPCFDTLQGVCAAPPASQISALQDFYIATSGSTTWDSDEHSWDFSGPLDACSGTWKGITCSGASISQLELPLYGDNMQGTLPGSLADLVDLIVIDLQGGQLSGTLPPEFGRWSNVQDINLGDNLFTETLPSEWGSLSTLQHLDLTNNQLSGTLPREWGSISSLRNLALDLNQLTGPLPREWGSLDLEVMDLSNNQLSGTLPSEWASMTTVKSLILDNNQIEGSFPGSYAGAWSNLNRFSAANNLLCGPLPSVPPGADGAIVSLDRNYWSCPLPSWCLSGGSTCGTCFLRAQGVCSGIGAGGDPHVIDTNGNSFDIPIEFGDKILALYHDEHLHINVFVNRTLMFITHIGASFVNPAAHLQRHHFEAVIEDDYPAFYLDGSQISDLSENLPFWIRATQPHTENSGVLSEMQRYQVLEVELDGMFTVVGGYYPRDGFVFFNIQVTRVATKVDVENHLLGLLQTERNPHLNDLEHYVRTQIFE